MVHLGKIVVFGAEPENGNRFGAALRDRLSPTQGRDRLVDAVRWTGEEADLLSGNHGDSTGGEAIETPCGFGRKNCAGSEAGVLFTQDLDYGSASFRV